MKRMLVFLALAAAACDAGPKVVVRASLDGRPVADMPVRLLPYDRQAILDSLSAALEMPEPAVPQDLLQQMRSLETDSAPVKPVADTAYMRRLRERTRARSAEAAALRARYDSIVRARAVWSDTMTRLYDEAARQRQADLGLTEHADTTDAQGRAELGGAEGKWWVVASYVLPEATLEWTLPVTIRGDSAVVTLTRQNARERPAF
jgi:hypothetical protein